MSKHFIFLYHFVNNYTNLNLFINYLYYFNSKIIK
jgi:hypothetical protein